MHFWHLVFRPDSLTYTLCRALRECGHEVSVWIVDPEHAARAATAIQERLAAMAGVHLLPRDPARLPPRIERLIVQTFPRPHEAVRDLPLLAGRSARITLISAGDRSRGWREAMRLQWLEMRRLGRFAARLERVLYKDGFYPTDLFGLLRRREIVGFDVHSQFLHDPALFDLIHARDWDPAAPRPLLANFIGSSDPASRKLVLDAVRPLFVDAAGKARLVRPGKAMKWHEYPDANPIGLGTVAFVETLTSSDFTLCPRGYSLVTHRPIEAMLRGSIPVIEAGHLDLYGFELADGVNCVAVEPGRWPQAVERLAGMSEDAIAAMRRNIAALREPTLEYRRLAEGICGRIGAAALPVPA